MEGSVGPLGTRAQFTLECVKPRPRTLSPNRVVLSPPPSWERGGGILISSTTSFFQTLLPPTPDPGPLLLSLLALPSC